MALNAIREGLPRPVLQAHGLGGAVLSEGTICLLAGAGGVAKSTLALHIALGVAMTPDDGELHVPWTAGYSAGAAGPCSWCPSRTCRAWSAGTDASSRR